MKENNKNAIFPDGSFKEVLMKKALGYDCTETVEEYVTEDGEIKLTKKKVTKKNVPPDLSAIKILLESQDRSVLQMTDEELKEEKERLIKLLKKKSGRKKEKQIEEQD